MYKPVQQCSRSLLQRDDKLSRCARVPEYTENLMFADPVIQLGVPKLLTSLQSLELYASGSHQLLKWTPPYVLSPTLAPIKEWNHFILRRAMQKPT